MNTPNYLKKIKTAIFAFSMFSFAMVSAQQTTGDVTKESDIVPGTTGTGGAVRVIDNKGTIKYLQSKNGITILSNTTNDVTTTTWQLGGTLTDNTFIDVDDNVFGLNGIELETGAASTDATTESDAGTGTGWTILVRDEATGATKKILATNLIQSGQTTYTALAADETADPTISATGISTTASQVWVYRNGAKLLAGTDYTVATDNVNLTSAGYPIFTGDVFEIQWVK